MNERYTYYPMVKNIFKLFISVINESKLNAFPGKKINSRICDQNFQWATLFEMSK
jgi:hypothetical protein